MKDILTILETAQRRYDGYELSFRDQTQTVLSILRAKDVLARTRKAKSNRWHTLLAAALVVAYEDEHDLYVSTCRAQNLYRAGVTTRLTQWLDACVQNDLLITKLPTNKADGRLSLGEILTYYLAQPAAA
ncbi:hypothetical protein N9P29_00965 [bacterium]|nr:hypothetical protein [bacterium]